MYTDFRGLQAYDKSRLLVRRIYQATKLLPPSEEYGLRSQMRRASLSVVANLAEGFSRDTPAARARFLRISIGSINELEGFLGVCSDLQAFPSGMHKQLVDLQTEVARLFRGLLRYTLDTTRSDVDRNGRGAR